MKQIILFSIVIMISLTGFSQKRIQIKNQRFEMQAVRDGESIKVETKKFDLEINYDSGEISALVNIEDLKGYESKVILFMEFQAYMVGG